MKCSEKVAYLKGLMEGLEISAETKEGKVLLAISDVLEDLAEAVSGLSEAHNDLCDQVDAIDSDLGDVEEYLYECECDDDECECGGADYDGELYEVECPSCSETICVDESLIEEGGMLCPNCGEKLEFELDDELEVHDED